jgi:hypothetical protein
MKLITHEIFVRRWTNRYTFRGRQQLCRRTRILGIRIWTRVLDTERVPAWATIQLGTIGYTDWESKFAAHIGGGTA